MTTYCNQYIDGLHCPSKASGLLEVFDPNTGALAASVTQGGEEDVTAAVAAATRAFAAWFSTPLQSRIDAVRRFAAALEARNAELTQAIAAEVGTPLKISQMVQVDSPIRNCEHFIQAALELNWEQRIGHSLVVREAAGVVACITPWNFPLHQIVLKVVPALLAGNTIVLKPSELTPRTTQLICDAIDGAAFPNGVINVVNGLGQTVGAALARAPGVDMVSFTGSTEAGRAVSALAAPTVKKVTTELGGKSPAIILEGADLVRAVKATIGSCMLNNGQACNAQTRLLVHVDQFAEVARILQGEMAKQTLGSSLAEGTRVGPLISAQQQRRVKALVAAGVEKGARVLNEPAAVPAEGFFVAPIAVAVNPDNPLATDEVFGPVLSVICYHDIDDAIRLANDTPFGLAGAVWGDPDQAMAVARRIRAGQVDLNGARFNPLAPFGGFGQSGVGREGGVIGLEEFLQYKSIQTNTQA